MEAVSAEVADAGAAAQRPTAGERHFSHFEWEKRNENGGCPEVPSREVRDE